MLMSYHEINILSHFVAAIYQLMCCLKVCLHTYMYVIIIIPCRNIQLIWRVYF